MQENFEMLKEHSSPKEHQKPNIKKNYSRHPLFRTPAISNDSLF